MENRFCGQCGKPLGEQEIKPSWGLAWGLLWRWGAMYLVFSLLVGFIFLVVYLNT